MRKSESFQGTERFEVQRELGAGGMGVVYQVYDRELKSLVALKTLRQDDPAALYRFKQEFRSLADINHPNLVTLHELVSVGNQWFFTMELVDGVDFLSHVRTDQTTAFADTVATRLPTNQLDPMSPPPQRPASAPDDYERLRKALRQLAEGVHALHEAGKLHRDIKPSNVLVTTSGRVVVLDFGLVAELDKFEPESSNQMLVGTAVYMAPEQAASQLLSPSSDWYSVGVILYESLTGLVPFDGPPLAVVMRKQKETPTPPKQLLPDTPDDLNELCMGLLRIKPKRRPNGIAILRRLGSPAASRHALYPSTRSRVEEFIGRDTHFAFLDKAFADSRDGRAITVFLLGRSGMGKSMLLDRFVRQVRQHGAVVLEGRCYERENVPYKALDALVDSLTHYLSSLPSSQAAVLVPADAPSIARLFPVLRRVQSVAQNPRRTAATDPQELRRRGMIALRELFNRIAARKPLILTIDNLQWGDVDSVSLLIELLRPPNPPPLLLLVAYRSEEATASSAVRMFLRSIRTSGIDARDLIVGALSDDETSSLVYSKLGEHSPDAAAYAETLVKEARGNPFFVDELVRYIQSGAATAASSTTVSLDEAILARVDQLADKPRLLLELLAIAGRPMDQAVIADAVALGPEHASAVALLRAGYLIRTRGTTDLDRIEVYHERIRETIVANLPIDRSQALHARMARALEASGQATPEALVLHFQGAGDDERAGDHAASAAAKAAKALAFERAAELYRLAIDCLPESVVAEKALRARLGDALANAGLGAQAAEEYTRAAKTATAADALELKRRAAQELLRAGYVDDGLDTLRSVLDAVGLRIAGSPQRALASLISRRAQMRVRGLNFRERDTSQISAEELTRIDVCWSAATGLGMIDTILGADFQARHLLLALKAGEPYRVARALAIEAMYSANGGLASWKRTSHLLDLVDDLAERLANPHVTALATMASALAQYQAGRYPRALDGLERASTLLRDECTGVAFEIALVQRFISDTLYYLGEIAELTQHVRNKLREAERRGDLYSATDMRSGLPNFIWLAAGDPDRARKQADEGMERWSQSGFHLQHYYHAMARINADIYLGDVDQARARVLDMWPKLQRSLLLRTQSLKLQAWFLRGRAAVAHASAHDDSDALDDAQHMAKKLAKDPLPAGAPSAQVLQAGIAYVKHNHDRCAAHLRGAATGFDQNHMRLMAAACRHMRGRLIGASEGATLQLQANDWMRGQDIADPQRITTLLVGFEPQAGG